MDFFEAQARAKKRTTRLVVLFVFAVIGTILASYFAVVFGLGAMNEQRRSRRFDNYEYSDSSASLALWQPQLFFGVSAAVLVVVAVASLVKWNEFSSGGSAVAESVNGRRVDPYTTDLKERRLLNVVEEMAIASGTPVPTVYILDEEAALNAFAAGLTSSDAVVAVTRGTVEKLTRDELQGVIGHEFSHILNGDMRLNLRITAIIFGILVLGLAGRGILWTLGRGRIRGGKNSGGAVVVILAAGVALLVIGYVGYFFGRLIQAAVSRQREFLADASSVQFTRNPAGLTGALKKIGGYALGSTLETHKAAEISHFFFAQSFRSSITGLWATHPPLVERIRAIDPQFDGKMVTPPEVIDISRDSFASAGLAPASTRSHFQPLTSATPAGPTAPARAAVASIGTLTPAQLANAQLLLDSVPPLLRESTRNPAGASAVIYGLLLDDQDPAVRDRQKSLVANRTGADARRTLDDLESSLRALRPEHRLPITQLALPTLRQIPPAALSVFFDTLNELIHADSRVSPFEFALQKILTRTLALGRDPAHASIVQFYSFNAVIDEICIVLSALAHTASNVDMDARAAFAAGTAQLKLIENQLTFLDESACDFEKLDAALDKLAAASLPIKQRTLIAAAHVVGADGQILVCEAELLRAISAALDVPMPPLTTAA